MFIKHSIKKLIYLLHKPKWTADQLKRILIVDDAAINRTILKHYLKRFDISVDEAASGQRAIDMHNLQPYNIIFMDINMQDMSGIETSTRMLKEHPLSIIIACTGHITKSVVDQCYFVGIKKCLAKPIKQDEIHRLLDIYL